MGMMMQWATRTKGETLQFCVTSTVSSHEVACEASLKPDHRGHDHLEMAMIYLTLCTVRILIWPRMRDRLDVSERAFILIRLNVR